MDFNNSHNVSLIYFCEVSVFLYLMGKYWHLNLYRVIKGLLEIISGKSNSVGWEKCQKNWMQYKKVNSLLLAIFFASFLLIKIYDYSSRFLFYTATVFMYTFCWR